MPPVAAMTRIGKHLEVDQPVVRALIRARILQVVVVLDLHVVDRVDLLQPVAALVVGVAQVVVTCVSEAIVSPVLDQPNASWPTERMLFAVPFVASDVNHHAVRPSIETARSKTHLREKYKLSDSWKQQEEVPLRRPARSDRDSRRLIDHAKPKEEFARRAPAEPVLENEERPVRECEHYSSEGKVRWCYAVHQELAKAGPDKEGNPSCMPQDEVRNIGILPLNDNTVVEVLRHVPGPSACPRQRLLGICGHTNTRGFFHASIATLVRTTAVSWRATSSS